MNSFAAATALLAAATAMPILGGPAVTILAHHGTVYQTDAAGDPTEGFFEIENTGAVDTLTAASCPIADTTILVGADGKPVDSLTIPADQDIKLTDGTPHLLLQNTHFSVQYGGIIPCSLTFANAGTLSIFLYAEPKPPAPPQG